MNWHCEDFDALGVQRLYALLRLRAEVFVVEQRCFYVDADGLDPQCLHLSGWQAGVPLTYARLVPPGLKAVAPCIGRVLTAPAARACGLGHELVSRSLAACATHWPGQGITLYAQAHLRNFYERHGFAAVGDVFDEDGIPHLRMDKKA